MRLRIFSSKSKVNDFTHWRILSLAVGGNSPTSFLSGNELNHLGEHIKFLRFKWIELLVSAASPCKFRSIDIDLNSSKPFFLLHTTYFSNFSEFEKETGEDVVVFDLLQGTPSLRSSLSPMARVGPPRIRPHPDLQEWILFSRQRDRIPRFLQGSQCDERASTPDAPAVGRSVLFHLVWLLWAMGCGAGRVSGPGEQGKASLWCVSWGKFEVLIYSTFQRNMG